MGRTQTFDTAEAVRSARAVFWKHGYEAASVPALEAATGLRRSSIYHAFGSKRGLFDAAVDSYLDEIVRPRLAPLAEPAPGAILDYLRGLREALERAGSFIAANGCLLINAAGAAIADDEAVRETITAYRAELGRAIGNGIRAHRPDLDDAETDRLTATCTALVVAAYALARVDTVSAVHSLDTALDLVRRP
ncbi:helix-turn-helix domain containing protein [Glycomyces luteolus]|uniref:Helix-turn-helix domain containing protein n=1 Tax=Glycomyces luteolus TaxID=2670330 RepID=A0A9X3SSJ7_9ACTN|nr:TetR/AcrR family transcriptional regulator [Glycomyces luteolus]MDA1363012.1 helix-turn-helix domain containing protein [Glycomyces luteolus]